MLRRLSLVTVVLAVLLGLPSDRTAVAQEDQAQDDEAPAEAASYGDVELIELLREYRLLDDWVAASPVSAQASLLRVTGGGDYQAQRRTFLTSLDSWANRTEQVRADLGRIDQAQAGADRLRLVVNQVHDALVLDDRLAPDSNTLAAIEDALSQLATLKIAAETPAPTEDPLALAEAQLRVLREAALIELGALNGVEPAYTVSGIAAFVGFEQFQIDLGTVDQHLTRSRQLIKPAQQESERLASSIRSQMPRLHATRMLGSTSVRGLSVVTVDAYIRAAARSSCAIDWALLAGIGQVESNHGRLGGASVSGSGQVAPTIFGPLLDGGESERDGPAAELSDDQRAAITEVVKALQRVQAAIESFSWDPLDRFGIRHLDRGDELEDGDESGDQGNGFAVVVDSDDGRLDGNERWDRAIGPMQFLPETWSKWATDGNGDGVADPHNLYDATASAGRFLCHLSATRGASPSTFVLGYNASSSYVRDVLSVAGGLRATSLPDQ